MRQGDVWQVALEGQTGTETGKPCRAVLVTPAADHPRARHVQVVPLRAGQATVFPWEAPVTVKGEAVTAVADPIATVPKSRLTTFVDRLSEDDWRRVQQALRTQLGL